MPCPCLPPCRRYLQFLHGSAGNLAAQESPRQPDGGSGSVVLSPGSPDPSGSGRGGLLGSSGSGILLGLVQPSPCSPLMLGAPGGSGSFKLFGDVDELELEAEAASARTSTEAPAEPGHGQSAC